MTDMLIRNIDPKLKREIEKRALEHGHSLSDEAKLVLRRGLEPPTSARKIGADLVFEIPGDVSDPPDFK